MSTVTRKIKNVVKQYTFAEIKVREATSNDAWGPTSKQLDEVTELSHHSVAIVEILGIIWKRLSERGKNWRHVYKSLIVLDHLIKCGSEKVAQQSQEKMELLKSLSGYDFYEENKDVGAMVRDKSKQIISLLNDQDRLGNERMKRLNSKKIYAQNTSSGKGLGSPDFQHQNMIKKKVKSLVSLPVSPMFLGSAFGDDDYQLQLALKMSIEEHEEEERRKNLEEMGLRAALEESRNVQDFRNDDVVPPSADGSTKNHKPLEKRLTLLSIARQHSDKVESLSDVEHFDYFRNIGDDVKREEKECYDPWEDLVPVFDPSCAPQSNDTWNQKAAADSSFTLADFNCKSFLEQKMESQEPSAVSQKPIMDQGLATFSTKHSTSTNVQPQFMFSPTNPFCSLFVPHQTPDSAWNVHGPSSLSMHATPDLPSLNKTEKESKGSSVFNKSQVNFSNTNGLLSTGMPSIHCQATNPFL